VLRVASEGKAEFGGGEIAALDIVEIVATKGIVRFSTGWKEFGGRRGFLGEEFFLSCEVVSISQQEDHFAVAGILRFQLAKLANRGKGFPFAEEIEGGA